MTLNLAETAFRGALGAHMILPSVAMFVGAAGSPDREKTRMQMNRRSLPRYLGVLTVVIALAVSSFGCGANIERGKVLFGTDKPAEDSKCTASAAVTSVSVTTSVYATYVFKAKPADEVISLEVTKDGQSFLPSTALPTSDTKGLDCFGDISDLSKLPNWATGTFHFKLTSPTDTVAEGDLTVK